MAWAQSDFNEYIRLVRSANKDYERFRKSNLHNLTDLLRLKNFSDTQAHKDSVQKCWTKVPADRKTKYSAAWQYVSQTLFPPPPKTPKQPFIINVTAPHPAKAFAAIANEAQAKNRLREIRTEASVRECINDLTQVNNGGNYGWKAIFTLRLVKGGKQGSAIVVIVKLAAFSGNGPEQRTAVANREIGAIPANYIGAALTDTVKLNWKSRISERWSRAVFVVKDASGKDLDTYSIEWDFDWAGAGEDAGLNKVYAVKANGPGAAPDGTINTHYWGVDDGGTMGAAIAHEFGHLIGNPDEYGVTVFKGRNNVRNAKSIMDDETSGNSQPGHYWMVANEIADFLSVNRARCVVRLDAKEYNVANDHPWL